MSSTFPKSSTSDGIPEKVLTRREIWERRQTEKNLVIATFVCLFFTNFNAFLIPASYNALRKTLSFSLLELGATTTFRAFLGAASFPLWMWITNRYSRAVLLSVSCAIWAIFSILNALVSTFVPFFLLRGMAGIGIHGVLPITTSLVGVLAEIVNEQLLQRTHVDESVKRTVYAVSSLGILASLLLSILAAEKLWSFHVWRIQLFVLSVLGIGLAVIIWAFSSDPRHVVGRLKLRKNESLPELTYLSVKPLLSHKLFVTILFAHALGSIGRESSYFILLWLQETNVDRIVSAIIVSLMIASVGFSSVISTIAGEMMGAKERVSVSAFAVVKRTSSNWYLYGIFGICGSWLLMWPHVGMDMELTEEIFDDKQRPLALLLLTFVSGISSSFGTLLVGIIAQYSGEIGKIDSFSMALLICTAGPWTLQLLIYFFAYIFRSRRNVILPEVSGQVEEVQASVLTKKSSLPSFGTLLKKKASETEPNKTLSQSASHLKFAPLPAYVLIDKDGEEEEKTEYKDIHPLDIEQPKDQTDEPSNKPEPQATATGEVPVSEPLVAESTPESPLASPAPSKELTEERNQENTDFVANEPPNDQTPIETSEHEVPSIDKLPPLQKIAVEKPRKDAEEDLSSKNTISLPPISLKKAKGENQHNHPTVDPQMLL